MWYSWSVCHVGLHAWCDDTVLWIALCSRDTTEEKDGKDHLIRRNCSFEDSILSASWNRKLSYLKSNGIVPITWSTYFSRKEFRQKCLSMSWEKLSEMPLLYVVTYTIQHSMLPLKHFRLSILWQDRGKCGTFKIIYF